MHTRCPGISSIGTSCKSCRKAKEAHVALIQYESTVKGLASAPLYDLRKPGSRA